MTSFYIILGVILWAILAFWPAILAKRKGYSFILTLICAWLISFVITLIVVLFLKDKNESAEDRAASQAAEAALEKEENR